MLNPHEGAVKLQNEVENLTKMLSKVTQELNKTQEEKEELRGMNMVNPIYGNYSKYNALFLLGFDG